MLTQLIQRYAALGALYTIITKGVCEISKKNGHCGKKPMTRAHFTIPVQYMGITR